MSLSSLPSPTLSFPTLPSPANGVFGVLPQKILKYYIAVGEF